MKILFVCQQYIHSARWINQLRDTHHEVYVFDCLDHKIHEDLRWTHYTENWSKRKLPKIKGEYSLGKKFPRFYSFIEPWLKVTASEKLNEIIQKIQPDLVHSLEMQSETYHLLKVKKRFLWAYFSWGSDLYLYQDKKAHSQKIRNVLSQIDYFFTDNSRDVSMAKELGFRGTQMPIYPGGGGYYLEKYKPFITPIEDRKLILIKGYHHWTGRALKILEAIELVTNEIPDYQIYVYSAHNIVVDKIKEMNKSLDTKIQYSSRHDQISHDKLLNLFGKARIAIASSISDGIPNTLLETIILGAFPIQSNPGKVTEDYITHNKNGFLITNPEDEKEISELIIRSIKETELLESAFQHNQKIAKTLEYDFVREKVLNSYSNIEDSL